MYNVKRRSMIAYQQHAVLHAASCVQKVLVLPLVLDLAHHPDKGMHIDAYHIQQKPTCSWAQAHTIRHTEPYCRTLLACWVPGGCG